ncbi:MAG: HlyD family secretion protein [Acidobacteriia bacterium]|nr:HlyD family secretion protein [Terriglobia bacterium]
MTLSDNAESRTRSARPVLKIALVLIVGAALAGAYYGWRYFADRESTDDAQIDGHIVPVASRVGGTVLEVKIDDNQYTAAGTLLVQIDSKDYEVALAREEANLADAQASLQAARSGVPIVSTTTESQVSSAAASLERMRAGATAAAGELEAARSRLTTAQARLREATANRVRLTQDLDRMKKLIVKDEISRQQYDAAIALEEGARAGEDAARSAISEAEHAVAVADSRLAQADRLVEQAHADVHSAETGPDQVAVTRARAAAAEAKVKLAEAAVEQARLNLQYTTIRSPVSGVVSKKNVEPGQIVQPGQPLLALVPLEDIWVTANFKETQLHSMRAGQRVSITVDAYGRKFWGRVESIAAATGARFSLLPPENATGNYVKVVQRIPVKILFDKGQDPEHLLRPGMSVVPTVFMK